MKKTNIATAHCCTALAVLMVAMTPTAAWSCPGDRTPAEPVVANLQLENWGPTDPVGVALPSRRDSTDYITLTLPGWQSGHELFKDVDILDDRLFVAYNAGYSVWDISGQKVGNPEFLGFRDGWVGHFMNWADNFEEDSFIEEISVQPLGGAGHPDENLVLIALSGREPVGFSAWIYDKSNDISTRVYQQNDNHSFQVRLIKHTNGRFYAFSSRPDGVRVYDLTQARAIGPCFDDKLTSIDECPGVDRGMVGNMTTGRYVDVLQTAVSSEIFIAATDQTFGSGVDVEVYKVTDPSDPTTAQFKMGGLSSRSFGTTMFLHSGNYYLAAVERENNVDNILTFFNITSCITGGACNFNQKLGEIDLLNFSTAQYLSFSKSGDDPFVYYGGAFQNLAQPTVELLLDLSTIHPSAPNQNFLAKEITDSGPTYTDACNGQQVGYWGWYYPKNEFGLKNVSPRRGKFSGDYFYRAAFSVLDVHTRNPTGGGGGGGTPTVRVTVNSPPTYWMNEDIGFTGTTSNCTAVPTGWSWSTDDTFATNPPDNDDAVDISFPYCPSDDCPVRTVEVSAENSGCPAADIDSSTISVREPRAQIRSLTVTPSGSPSFEYPVCTLLTFDTTVDGKAPYSYQWTLKDEDDLAVVDGVTGQNSRMMSWNTQNVDIEQAPEIFLNGFESGDFCSWAEPGCIPKLEESKAAESTPPGGISRLEQVKLGLLPSATFTAEIEVSNLSGPDAHTTPPMSQAVTLTALGLLEFELLEISSSTPDGGQFDFVANTKNATEWRWVVEDPANGTSSGADCAPLSVLPGFNCEVFDWSSNDTLTYQWIANNVIGTYGVAVQARNCSPSVLPIFATTTANVTSISDPEPLDMTQFKLDPSSPCDFFPLEQSWVCPEGVELTFLVAADGDPTAWQFDWEGTGTWDGQVAPNATVTHAFTSSGAKAARVRAVRNADISDPMDIEQDLEIEAN